VAAGDAGAAAAAAGAGGVAARAVFAAAWSPSPRRELPEARRALQGELAALRTVNADALADAGGADAGWPVSAAAEDLAFLALSLPPQRPAPPPAARRTRSSTHLDALGAALSGPTGPRPAPASRIIPARCCDRALTQRWRTPGA
jgi:hypothetical protein